MVTLRAYENVPCDVELVPVPVSDVTSGYTDSVPGCGHDNVCMYVSITLPGGVPVPTFTVCKQCSIEIREGE